MKKTLNAIIVIILGLCNANALASIIDFNIHNDSLISKDNRGVDNAGAKNGNSKEA